MRASSKWACELARTLDPATVSGFRTRLGSRSDAAILLFSRADGAQFFRPRRQFVFVRRRRTPDPVRSLTQCAGRESKSFTETPVEIGNIAESAGQHDLGDAHRVVASSGQHPMHFQQPKFENMFG